jgi:hypothetical protein
MWNCSVGFNVHVVTGAFCLLSEPVRDPFNPSLHGSPHLLGEKETMNTRSRITLSTVLGLTLLGLCLGSAQAQTGMKKPKMQKEMKHDKMMADSKMEEMMEAAPIGYPFAAPGCLNLYPGGLHFYHEEAASMKMMKDDKKP